MQTFWFTVITLMLTVYAILDGFDLGVGVIHHFAGKDERERHMMLRAIGPVWDGNEVWLVAAGGALFSSFPILYATSFSGFYLPLMMVLWLLMFRAIGIELRGHLDNRMWRQFWDFVFTGASALLSIFLGAALGNVIRGVPLNQEKFFFEPLWTNFLPHGQTGILDWYTVLTGLIALIALTVHGANYIALKTIGDVQRNARRIGKVGGLMFAIMALIGVLATLKVRPQMIENYNRHLWGWAIPLVAVGGLAGILYFRTRERDLAAFLSSSAAIAGMIGGAAFGLYPVVLPSTFGAQFDLTIWNASAQAYGLRIGVIWWSIGIVLAIAYFSFLYYTYRGKVSADADPASYS